MPLLVDCLTPRRYGGFSPTGISMSGRRTRTRTGARETTVGFHIGGTMCTFGRILSWDAQMEQMILVSESALLGGTLGGGFGDLEAAIAYLACGCSNLSAQRTECMAQAQVEKLLRYRIALIVITSRRITSRRIESPVSGVEMSYCIHCALNVHQSSNSSERHPQ